MFGLGLVLGEEVFVSYIDENNTEFNGYFILLSLDNHLIQLQSKNNIIAIPYLRLIKIKQKIK